MKALILERSNQQSEQTKAALLKARQETDAAWSEFQIVQNALVITDANPDRYTAFILHLNEQIDHYHDLAEARRKQNRRVMVQSDVVDAEKTYQLVGYTA